MAQDAVQLSCTACGQRNRVPYAKVGATGRCGKCKAPLPQPAAPIEVDRADALQAVIQRSSVPVVVDFWASWCGPCRMVAPEIVKIAEAHAGQWLVVKANTERDPSLGAAHGVRSIPTLAVFRGGREVGRTAGARPAPAIERFVEQSLAT